MSSSSRNHCSWWVTEVMIWGLSQDWEKPICLRGQLIKWQASEPTSTFRDIRVTPSVWWPWLVGGCLWPSAASSYRWEGQAAKQPPFIFVSLLNDLISQTLRKYSCYDLSWFSQLHMVKILCPSTSECNGIYRRHVRWGHLGIEEVLNQVWLMPFLKKKFGQRAMPERRRHLKKFAGFKCCSQQLGTKHVHHTTRS